MAVTNLDALTLDSALIAVTQTVSGTTLLGGLTRLSGDVTATAAGKTVSATKLSITGTATRGTRTIATAGSSTLTYSGIPAKTSPMFITGRSTTKNAKAMIMTQTAGAAKVGLYTGSGTAATGSIHWVVV